MRKILYLHAVMLWLVVPIFAQGGGPLGGGVQPIAIDPNNPAIIYIGTATGGAFKSTNSGGTWTSVSTGNFSRFVLDLAIDPTHSTTIYAATGGGNGGIFKSVDGATTWTLANTGIGTTNLTAVAVDPVSPSTVYAGTSAAGIFKSTDGASTWTSVNSGLTTQGIESISIDPANPSTLYAATNGGGVFKSTTGGTSWAPVNLGLSDSIVLAVAVDTNNPAVLYAGTNSTGIFKSINGGGSWIAANTGITFASPSIRRIAIDRNNSGILYAASFAGVFKSLNAGSTWFSASSGMGVLENSSVPGAFGVAIDPTNSATVYVTTLSEGGVFKTTNGGASWNALNAGLAAAEISAIVIDRFHPTTLYAATTSNATYKSTNAGLTWFEANSGFSTVITLSLAIDPNTTTTLYAGTRNRGGGEGVFKTTDGGLTWSRVGFGILSPVRAIGINPGGTSTVYAATFGSGIFKSTDAGAPVNTGLADKNVQCLVIDPSNPNTIYAGTDNGLFKSVDSGATWTPFSSGLTNTNVLALAIDPSTTSTIFAGTNSGIFKSTNGGGTWTASSSGITAPQIIHAIVIDPTKTSTIYLGKASQGLVFKSVNGGQTWSDVSTGLPTFPTFLAALAIDPLTPTNIYAGTDSSGIFKSTIGGGTWQPTGAPVPLCAFSFSPTGQSFGAAGGLASFAVTTNPACSWSPSPGAPWITILPGGSKGPGKVNYAVVANKGGPRTGAISVGGQNFNIDQQALTCTFSIAPAVAAFTATGGSARVVVNAPAGCAWTATSNATWMTLTSGASGTSNGAVILQAVANVGGARLGTVSIAGQTLSATQAAPVASACGASDVASLVSISSGGFSWIPPGQNLYHQEITLSNRTGSPVNGPIYYVLVGLPKPPVGLTGGFQLTHCFSSQGDSMVLVAPGGLPATSHVTFGLDYVIPFPLNANYAPKVLSGRPTN